VLVSWLGGEPLLWTPLAEVSRAYRTQHGLDLSLTTNGTRLDRNAIRVLLLEYDSEVTISIDGFAAAHDAQRGRPGLHSALEQSVTRLAADKRAAGQGPLLRANVVLMRGNIAHFAPLCRELPRWGIEEITFNQLGGNGQPEIFPANRLSPKQARAFAAQVPALRRELADMGVRLCGTDD
jgi:sulfatase maturation enzyme AslB (radical SAM superfamily)